MKLKINVKTILLLLFANYSQSLLYTDCYKKSLVHLPLFRAPAFKGKYLDVQWNIHRENFQGKWNNSINWYNNNSDYNKPFIRSNNNYELTFINNSTGIYRKNNGKIMIITKTNYNSKGSAFMFPSYHNCGGVGGQSNRIINYYLSNNDYFTHEINFFFNKIRLIIIVNYKYNNNKIRIQSIGISNNEYNNYFQIDNIKLLVLLISTWKGYYLSFSPHMPFNYKRARIEFVDFTPFLLNSNRICKIYPNNLIISIPKIIDDYNEFSMYYGCLQSPFLYKQLIINYDYDGVLTCWEYLELKPFLFDF